MKKYSVYVFAILFLGLYACSKNAENEPEKTANQNLPARYHKVTVIDHMNASNYSYIQCQENGNKFWIAVQQMPVENGETLYFSKSMEMKNFKSETLKRTFKSILFVEDISKTVPNKSEEIKEAHEKIKSSRDESIHVEPLKDGKTIKQIYSDSKSLKGKVVKVRGVVTKYNPNIMGRNWIHIQDGTSDGNNYDLMITSQDQAALGDKVEIEGSLALNKDFGAGYSYPVMLENAKVTVEK